MGCGCGGKTVKQTLPQVTKRRGVINKVNHVSSSPTRRIIKRPAR